MPVTKDKSFWERFGSALSIKGKSSDRIRCYWHGRDICKTKANEALAEDWKYVGLAIGGILKRYHEEEDESIRRR